MKRIAKILAWLVAIVLVLMGVLLLAIALFDWNRLKPTINSRASAALGRAFAINGDLGVVWQRNPVSDGLAHWLPLPQFTARDITIANPDWAKQAQFTHLDGLRFQLALLPLLAHHVDIPSVQLIQPTVNLQRDKQGRATWDFTLPQSNEPSSWQVTLGNIGFDRGQIAFDDAVNQIQLQINISPMQQAVPYNQLVAQTDADAAAQASKVAGAAARKAEAAVADESNASSAAIASKTSYQFAWSAKGNYHGATANGDGHIGAVLALQDRSIPFPLQAHMQVGDTHISLIGTLTDPTNLAALDLKLWFAGSSMAKLYPIIGVTLPDTPRYATQGRLQGELHRHGSHFSYQHFRGRVGGSDLAGDLDYASLGDRPKLSGNVHSKLLQFVDLAPLIGADSNSEKQQRGDATPQPTDKVLPVEPFRTDRWRVMDADVSIDATHIDRGDKSLPIESLSTHLTLTNGLLRLDPLNFGYADGTVVSKLSLDGGKTPMQGALELRARHLKLKQLFPQIQAMQTSLGEINGVTSLHMDGNSVAALLGSANGELKLLMNDGAISKTLLETAGLNIGNVLIGKLFGDETVKINCAASDVTADNGVFTSKLFVFDTQDAVINVTGNADMRNEKLNLDVIPHTKGFRVFSLRSPLYVQGSFKNPSIGVHAGPLLARAGGAAALVVVAAPAAALLALVSPSHNDTQDNTCRAVLQQAKVQTTLKPLHGKSSNSKAATPTTPAAARSH